MVLHRRRERSLFALLATAVLLVSCSGDDKNPSTPVDPGAAAEKVRAANSALEQVLFEELNGSDPDRPNDVDFRVPDALYEEALGLDATNLDANLGSAVTNLLVLSTDAEINAAFDEWKAYMDAHTPFEIETSPGRPLGITLGAGLHGGRNALTLPYEVVPFSLLAHLEGTLAGTDPQLSRVQAILENLVMPRLQTAVHRLGTVAGSAGYHFTVTPRMQGDLEADPAELDQTDALSMRAAASLLLAACDIAVAYEVSFAAYDSTSLVEMFHPGSGWMALKASGAARTRDARQRLLAATDDVERAITALLAESDSQDDDIIKIGPDQLSRADVESVRVHLDDARALLTSGYTRVDDWDGDGDTPDVSLRINAGAILENPVEDWKALLPPYTVRADRRVWDERYLVPPGHQEAFTVDSPEVGSRYASVWISVQRFPARRDSSLQGPEWLTAPLLDYLAGRVEDIQTEHPDYTDIFVQASASGTFIVGPNTIYAGIWQSYTLGRTWVVVPTLVWSAPTFDDWVWPDPTFSGLLPDVGSTSELFGVFGITRSDWDPEWVLDWTH